MVISVCTFKSKCQSGNSYLLVVHQQPFIRVQKFFCLLQNLCNTTALICRIFDGLSKLGLAKLVLGCSGVKDNCKSCNLPNAWSNVTTCTLRNFHTPVPILPKQFPVIVHWRDPLTWPRWSEWSLSLIPSQFDVYNTGPSLLWIKSTIMKNGKSKEPFSQAW